jgi:hypothetical protein
MTWKDDVADKRAEQEQALPKTHRPVFSEGYRIGLYTGSVLGRRGIAVKRPPEMGDDILSEEEQR